MNIKSVRDISMNLRGSYCLQIWYFPKDWNRCGLSQLLFHLCKSKTKLVHSRQLNHLFIVSFLEEVHLFLVGLGN